MPMASHAMQIINADKYGDSYTLRDNTTIAPNAILDFDSIYLAGSIYLHNMGYIGGNIHMCPGCDVYIRNSGTLDSQFISAQNSNLVQVITGRAERTPIKTDGALRILVTGTTDMSIADLSIAAAAADIITLSDTTLRYSEQMNTSATWNLQGENTLLIDEIASDGDMLLLQNISGDGAVRVQINTPTPLYAATTFVADNNLYLRLVRDTDYYKILGGSVGKFLGAIRENNRNDKLLARLDTASNMDEINSVLNKSARVNTKRLNNPTRTLLRHTQMADTAKSSFPFTFGTFGIVGHDITAYGSHIGLRAQITSDLQLSLSGYGAELEFTDGIDDYSGQAIGATASLRYSINNLVAKAQFGMMKISFETPSLLYGDEIKYNPDGTATHASVDIGYNFSIGRTITVLPTAGITTEHIKTLNATNATFGHGAIDFIYTLSAADIIYSYAIRFAHNTSGDNMATGKIIITSTADDLSVHINAGIIDEEWTTSYTFGIDAQFRF